MAVDSSNPLIKTTIRVAAAGLGAAVAGPLGCALGAVIGDALGEPAEQLIGTYVDKFGEEAAKKLLETGADSLAEKLKKSAPNLESVYRESLRLSLSEIRLHAGTEYDDWFSNWDFCLKTSVPLQLIEIDAAQLAPEHLDDLFPRVMERLDAQGTAMRQKSQSLVLKTRIAPATLIKKLSARLPGLFKDNFRSLIGKDEYKEAWNEAELAFREYQSKLLSRIDENTIETRKMVEFLYEKEKSRSGNKQIVQDLQEKEREIEELTQKLQKLQEQLALRSSEPAEVEISLLLDAGDIDGALRLKFKQVEKRRSELMKLPRDLYELGIICELRFDWPQALDAYREAWELDNKPDYGFQYAVIAQKLNHLNEAIATYETLLRAYTEPSDRATVLCNLSVAYRVNQRLKEAGRTGQEALDLYRTLAARNPGVYLPGVATTLNNLAVLYNDTQRPREAEQAYDEALATYRELSKIKVETYLPGVAITLINLAVLYRNSQRPQEAEKAYKEALAIFETLAEDNPNEYLQYVARTLNNSAALYSETEHLRELELALRKAFITYKKLAEINPDRYRPDVAMTLNNLAILYGDTRRPQKADNAFGAALAIYRNLSATNPEAFLPLVATTLNNLASFEHLAGRTQEAEAHASEAEKLLEPQWKANHELHGNLMARILATRALIAYTSQQPTSACAFARRAVTAAYDPILKQRIQKDIDRFCG